MDKPTKVCSLCKEPKLLNEFNKRTISKDGYRSECRKCQNIANNSWRIANPEKAVKWQKDNPEKIKEMQRKYRGKPEAKLKESERKKKYNAITENKEKANQRSKEWYENNKSKIRKREKEQDKKNPYIKTWRRILKNCHKLMGTKKEGRTIDELGYSALEFKFNIESKMTDGMSWGNHGEWHIDHIIDVSRWPKETPMSVVNALSNLRPLWKTSRTINGVFYEGNLNRPKHYRKR